MARANATERDRWVLYQMMNGNSPGSRAERLKMDRLWAALKLDEVAAKVEQYPPQSVLDPKLFDHDARVEYEVTSDQRDVLIEFLGKPGLTMSGHRIVRELETDLIKARDGDAAAGKP